MERILITGGTGLVGNALKQTINKSKYATLFNSSRDCDLRSEKDTEQLISTWKPDAIIHLAAKVGGLGANINNNGKFYLDNIKINTNVLEAARKQKCKVLSLLSTCVYPDKATYPLGEVDIHKGPPHSSNFGYAYAKRSLDIQSRAYRQQYGCNFITAVPNNIFGEHDNYNLENGHVIPSIVHKVFLAKSNNTPLVLWGDGSAMREFTYSRDISVIIMILLEHCNNATPMNIGNSKEYTIKQIAEKICEIMGYDKEIIWDTSKPNGQSRKPSNTSKWERFRKDNEIDFQYTDLDKALKKSVGWFLERYPYVRK